MLVLLTKSQAQARRPMAYAGYGAGRLQAAPMAGVLEEPTRLYISNLDYAVSNDDIKVSFSCPKPSATSCISLPRCLHLIHRLSTYSCLLGDKTNGSIFSLFCSAAPLYPPKHYAQLLILLCSGTIF